MISSSEKTSVWLSISVTAIVTLWWLTAVQLELSSPGSSAATSAEGLRALFLARLICGAILLPRIVLTAGWACSLRALLLLVTAAWPLAITMAGAASITPLQMLVAELALASLLTVIATLTAWARLRLEDARSPLTVATLAGVFCATLCFGGRGLIFAWILA